MSVWARRLATFVPQDAASTRRASCSALDVCSLVYHDTVSSTSSKHWPSPLPDKSVYRSSHRACIGPSDTQINEPSTEYLGRKRSSLDPSWLSPTLNIKEKSLRSPARVDRLSESPVLEFLRPTSLYLTERLSPSTHQHTPLIQGVEPQPGVSLVSQDHLQPPQHPQRRHSFHHLPPATHASHTLGQHSPSAILFSPSTNFLRSPKVTEKGTNRSPFSDGSPLSPCPELSPTNTQFIYQYEEQESARGLAQVKERGAETVSDVRGLKENIQNRNCSERLLDVPQIILNTPETSLLNSVDLETTPASLGLSPTVAAAYHCQKTPGESEGLHTNFKCILALLDEPRSFSPDFNQSRRASWHVFLKNTTDSCHHHPGVNKTITDCCHHHPGVQISTRCPSATIHQHTRCLCMGVSPPVGGVIGRGGFGTVKVGRHKGVKVGVKVLHGGRAAASSQREAHALSLPPHAHLASTHALVTPSTTTGYACITWGVTCLNNIKEKNQIVSYEAAAAMFSLPVEDVVRWAGDAREEHGGRPG